MLRARGTDAMVKNVAKAKVAPNSLPVYTDTLPWWLKVWRKVAIIAGMMMTMVTTRPRRRVLKASRRAWSTNRRAREEPAVRQDRACGSGSDKRKAAVGTRGKGLSKASSGWLETGSRNNQVGTSRQEGWRCWNGTTVRRGWRPRSSRPMTTTAASSGWLATTVSSGW